MDNPYISGRSENNIKCVLHDDLGRKNRKLDIYCRVTGFTSDFLSLVVVEHIRFFHGAIQPQLISNRRLPCKHLSNSIDEEPEPEPNQTGTQILSSSHL